MDNASIHKTKTILETLESKQFIPIYIPPYTPECNPIENIFSVVKNRFRKTIAIDNAKLHPTIIEEIVSTLNGPKLFKSVFEHMQKHISTK
jgi:transposase